MTSFFTYVNRVFIPRFSKSSESFSSYGKSGERKYQVYFWVFVVLTLGSFGFHLSALVKCASIPRATVCFMNMYTWALYMFFAGMAVFQGMILHYGYTDPKAEEFHDIDEHVFEEEEEDDVL